MFWLGFSKKKFFFLKKKIQNGRLKKSTFFKIANSERKILKISWIGPWVSRIEWCKGHQSILLTQGPICKILATIAHLLGVVEKLSFFESAILNFFFRKKKNFCFIPMKISPHLQDSKDFSKFWWLLWFPAKTHSPQTF